MRILFANRRLRFERGDIERAAELFEDAVRAQEDYQARFFAAQCYMALGREAEAEAAYRRALHVLDHHMELNPDDARAATMCAVALCRIGRRDDGLVWALRARTIDPEDLGILYNVACLYALVGEATEALDCLERSMRAGFGTPEWIANGPDLAGLRGDPRFRELLEARSQ